jgi:hypothetical protein
VWLGSIFGIVDAVVSWLLAGDEDPGWWKTNTQVVELCLTQAGVLLEARGPIVNDPLREPLERVVSLLESMIEAMKRKERAASIAAGLEILEAMVGSEV